MTFDEYIQNPMGKENAVISNRNMYRILYSEKLDKILVREAGNIVYKLYKEKNKYFAYLKIPSEVIDKFYYDVVVEFTPPKGAITGTTLKDYSVRFYSNDPSFVFTFAHAFIENGMFITEYKDKMSKKAVKQVAKEKNPKNQVGYVKSLYFAYLYMSSHGLFAKIRYIDKYNEAALKREIMHADRKIELRQEAQQQLDKQKKKARVAVKKQISDSLQKELPVVMSNKPHIGKVKSVGSVGGRKTSTVKHTKTVGRK